MWVPNHGGRQLDLSEGSIDALPSIVDAVAGRAAGVACALDILHRELRTTMALAGQTSVKNRHRDLVFRVD